MATRQPTRGAGGIRRPVPAPFSLSFLLVLLLAAQASPAQEHPNILFVFTDDLGWGDTTAYNPDSRVDTPTIEQLAADGMRFTDAHTSAAKCAPSRYSAITGNYHWRGRKGWGQWNYKGGSQILAGQRTLGDLLQQAGYRTAFIGKAHLGGHFYRHGSDAFASSGAPDTDVDFSRPMQDGLNTKGFDHSFVLLRGIQDSPYAYFENDELFGDAAQLFMWEEGTYDDTVIRTEGLGLPDWSTRDVGPTLLQAALDFIADHHDHNLANATAQPFFLYYNTEAVHSPRVPPLEIAGTPILGSTVSDRLDMVKEIDAAFGALLDELDSLGLLEDTLVIFTSDNGGQAVVKEARQGHQANAHFRGSKGRIYEGGHRVPLIVRWGDGTHAGSRIAPGSVSDVLVGVQDLYRTLASLAGVAVDADQGRDSFDLLPVLLGHTSAPVRDHMIQEADAALDGSRKRSFAYREGEWKLHLDEDGQPERLYDLAADPGEANDLLADPAQAERVAGMWQRFGERRAAARTAPQPGATNQPPQVNAGPDQSTELPEDTITLQGTVSDDGLPEGALEIEWSVQSGPAAVSFGDASAAVTTATFTEAGSYVLRLLADDGELRASDRLNVTVSSPEEDTPPAVSITSPEDGATFEEGTQVPFAGKASDAEDGNLSGALAWTSDRDGAIGMGGSFSTGLSEGTHRITASATDSGGLSGSDSISVTVIAAGQGSPGDANAAPVVVITSPEDGESFAEGSSVTFTASGTDEEDGSLGASLAWASDRDGAIGTGESISAELSVGTHEITASAVDSGGLAGSDSVTITIEAAGGGDPQPGPQPGPEPGPEPPSNPGGASGGSGGGSAGPFLIWLLLAAGVCSRLRLSRSAARRSPAPPAPCPLPRPACPRGSA